MGREMGCDPELSLRLGTGRQGSSGAADSAGSSSASTTRAEDYWLGNKRKQQPSQQISIFHNGKVCVCDVTEIQARAIICMARKEMMGASTEDINTMNGGSKAESRALDAPAQLIINPALSMKRSLQRFLQKRKARMDSAASPYHCWDPRSPSPHPA